MSDSTPSKGLLKKDLTDEHWNKQFNDNYYWYLSSDEFKDTFIRRIGTVVGEISNSVLDVGCAEGVLVEYLPADVRYLGIDASSVAIERAREKYVEHYPNCNFEVTRMEDFRPTGNFTTVIFGGLFSVLVEPTRYIDFIENYRTPGSEFFVVYDLLRVDLTEVNKRYKNRWYTQDKVAATKKFKQVSSTKLHRKIVLYEYGN